MRCDPGAVCYGLFMRPGHTQPGRKEMNNIEFAGTITPNNTAFLIQRLAEALASGNPIVFEVNSLDSGSLNISVNDLLASTAQPK